MLTPFLDYPEDGDTKVFETSVTNYGQRCVIPERTVFINKTMYVERSIEARSRNRCCRGKPISITYCEGVCVDLVINHAKRMRRIILSSVACPAVPYFSTLSHERHDLRGKELSNIKCVF
jgi:hypothetical protein